MRRFKSVAQAQRFLSIHDRCATPSSWDGISFAPAWDQPTQFTLKDMLDAAGDATDRRVVRERILSFAKSRGVQTPPGLRRGFLGNENGDATLRLADASGRDRIRLVVDDADTARLEFLDATGTVVYALPHMSR